jgi:pilus assembly protein FimV
MKTAVRRILLLSALMSPGALYALGLGEIHLNSALNQPFDADIDLVSATQEDLGSLRAALANSETFTKYGIDRPGYLSDFTFRVAKGAGGQDVLKVTSPRPVTEPFVTLLVEASWPRGRLLREYTVLLDPPVFAPTPAAAEAPVATPRSTSAPAPASRAESLESQPPVAPERRAPRSVAAAGPGIEPGSTYRVQRNDTLWQIASAANPGSRSDVNRAMVAIFQNNPQAFDGNINVLRTGSVLKIPESGEVSAISASAASAEVARQYQMWKQGAAAAGGGEASGRLRLVTPEQGTAAPSTSTTVPAKPGAEAPAADLKARVGQLETELAEAKRLLEVRNAELATLQAQQAQQAQPGQPAQPTPAAGGEVAVTPPAAQAPAQPEAAAPTPAAEPTPPAAEPAAQPAAPEQAKPAKPQKPGKTMPSPAAQPSFLDRITQYWWVLLGLLAVLAGAWLLPKLRRSGSAAESDLEEALGRDLRAAARAPTPTPRPRDTDIVVEEKRPVEAGAQLPPVATAAEPLRRPVAIDDTISGEAAGSIEAGDPLAEADFHMAYGLYDQAADLVQLAIKREPRRRDLKLKLLEIFFVWGNKERFLGLARDIGASRAEAAPGEWDKVLIMGKQIAPEDPLFSGSPSAAPVDLDMELHGGTGTFDMNLDGGIQTPTDIDLTGSMPKVSSDASLDFVLDEPQRGVKDPASLAPTVEMPKMAGGKAQAEDTEEVSIEGLGFDVDSKRSLGDLDSADDQFAENGAVVEDTVENPTIGARAEDTVESPTIRRRAQVEDTVEEDMLSSTSLMQMSEKLAAEVPGNAGETGIYELDETARGALTDATARFEVPPGGVSSVDFSLGGDEAATMSEVGTKLDLARAYIDMGDPEGARSILDEVLTEGSASQKQEAKRLMSSLP